MAFFIQDRGQKQFVVLCKGCKRDIPSGVDEFPFKSIIVTCPACWEKRYYLPSEVGLGFMHYEVLKLVRTQAKVKVR